MVVISLSYLVIMNLNKSLLAGEGWREHVYLCASQPSSNNGQLHSGPSSKWTVQFNNVKMQGADGSKTLLEEMKYMQLVAVYLFT